VRLHVGEPYTGHLWCLLAWKTQYTIDRDKLNSTLWRRSLCHGPHAMKKGRNGLISTTTRDPSLTAAPICAFDVLRAKRHVWLRIQGDMQTLGPVVASLSHRVKAHRKGVKNEPPLIGGQTCCQDRHVRPSASLSPHSQAAWRRPNKWVGSGYNL
jgi:hypothetical protein